jgi:hypothetical protein
MTTRRRARQLTGTAVLAVVAYGAGMWLGHRASHRLHSPGATVAGTPDSLATPSAIATPHNPATLQTEPAADCSAFLKAPGTMIQCFESKVRELDQSDKRAFERRLDELRPLLFLLSTNDYLKVWSSLKDLRSSEARACLSSMLIEIWSRRAPRAALSALLALPEGRSSSLLRIVEQNWGAAEPDAALAWVRELPAGEQRDGALAEVAGGLAEHDPAAAIRLLEDLPPGGFRDGAALRIAHACSTAHPEAVTALMDQAKHVFQQQDLFEAVGRGWPSRSAADALAWAQSLTNANDRNRALSGVIAQMADTQPGEAMQVAISQPDAESRDQLVGSLAGRWAEGDLLAAADWLRQLPEGPLRQRVWEGMSREWTDQDPAGAAEAAMASLPAGETRTAALARVAHDGLEAGWDEQAALQSASRLTAGPDRDAFLSGLCEPVRGIGLRAEQAAGLVALMSPGQTREATIEKIAREWAKTDSAAARAWLDQTGLPDARKQALLRR